MSVIKQVSNAGVLRYPEISERVYVVNAGWAISALWGTIRPLLPTRTESKFRILSGGAESIFGEINGGDAALPDFVGGLLSEKDHTVCSALSVDNAYGIILKEIEDTTDISQYTDLREFFQRAHSHSAKFPKSDIHQARIQQIQKLTERYEEQVLQVTIH